MTMGVAIFLDSLDTVRLNFDSSSQLILNICLAFIMFGVALHLKPVHFRILLQSPRKLITGIVAQFLLLPAFTFFLVWLIEPMPSVALGMILVAACPGGNVSNFMSKLAGGNIALSVGLTAFATVMAIFLTPLNFTFYSSLYPPTRALLSEIAIEPGQMIFTVLLILGIPLLAGMWFNHRFEALTLKIMRPISVLSLLTFAAFVIIAFANNYEIFTAFIHRVFGLVLIHNALAFAIGWLAASWMKLPLPDRKSITIETGIQNSGLALVLIFTFFQGLGGMAMIAAWWGIWHLISGVGIATFFHRRFRRVQIQD